MFSVTSAILFTGGGSTSPGCTVDMIQCYRAKPHPSLGRTSQEETSRKEGPPLPKELTGRLSCFSLKSGVSNYLHVNIIRFVRNQPPSLQHITNYLCFLLWSLCAQQCPNTHNSFFSKPTATDHSLLINFETKITFDVNASRCISELVNVLS